MDVAKEARVEREEKETLVAERRGSGLFVVTVTR